MVAGRHFGKRKILQNRHNSAAMAALFNSSMNHTDAPDWLSRCCGDEINR